MLRLKRISNAFFLVQMSVWYKRELHDGYAFLLLLCQNCIKKKAATDIARPAKCFLSFMNHNWLKPSLMKHPYFDTFDFFSWCFSINCKHVLPDLFQKSLFTKLLHSSILKLPLQKSKAWPKSAKKCQKVPNLFCLIL